MVGCCLNIQSLLTSDPRPPILSLLYFQSHHYSYVISLLISDAFAINASNPRFYQYS